MVQSDLPTIQESRGPVEFWDKENPRSVIRLLHPSLATKVEEAYFLRPEIFGMEEKLLYRTLKDENQQLSATDNRLRLSFWLEYDRAQAELREIRTGNVVAGVCTTAYFTDRYLKNTGKVAWLLTPPASYLIVAEEALQFGLEQLREVLEIDHWEGQGDKKRVNTKLLALKLKIVEVLDTRIQGAPVQKIAHLHAATKDANAAAFGESMESLEKRMKELEARERKMLGQKENVIDVNSEQS